MRRLFFCTALGVLLLPRLPAQAGTLVQFRTFVGDIDVELLDSERPVTVRNFLRYINSGMQRWKNMLLVA